MYQLCAQGDLLIERVEDIAPSGRILEPESTGVTVVSEGELTGHRHAIHERVVMFRDDNLARGMPSDLYVGHIRVESEHAMLRHEEHHTIALTPGTYRVRRQRQVEPFDVEIVKD